MIHVGRLLRERASPASSNILVSKRGKDGFWLFGRADGPVGRFGHGLQVRPHRGGDGLAIFMSAYALYKRNV